MEQKKRTGLVIAIAMTLLAAAFVSFGLPSFMGVPEVALPDLNQEEDGGNGGFQAVEITTDTVQSVIATLDRPDSYYRELTVTLSWSAGSSSNQVRIWAAGGYVKTAVTAGGTTQNWLVGDDTLYLWYNGDRTWREMEPERGSVDLAQRIPTYEDVLDLDPAQINAAGYETRNGKDCIYVEVKDDALDTLDRYWIETATGLLCGAETQENGKTVYQMAETALRIPLGEAVSFSLPDGTVLYESSTVPVQEKSAGQS